jgi:hypothetical protein
MIAIVTIAVEIMLKWLSPRYFCNSISQFQYDKDLGVIAKPNLRKSILTDHIIEIYTNRIGSRNYLEKNELLEYSKIVFCIGDSFTEGVGNMTDESYPFYLDMILNRKDNVYEKNYAVFNLGLGAYGSEQSYLILLKYTEIIRKNPDVIIYFICSNDPEDDILFKSGHRHKHVITGSPYHSRLTVAINEILDRSQIYYRSKQFVDNIIMKKRVNNINPNKKSTPALSEIKSDYSQPKLSISDQLSGLSKIISFSKENDIKLIISYTGHGSKEYEMLKEFAAENDIFFSDFNPDIKRMQSVFSRLPINNEHSGGHFRSWVNYIIASNFASLIRDPE